MFCGQCAKGLFITDNQGANWQKATLPRAKSHHQIIFSLGVKGRSILAGSNSYVYLSDDFGLTWEQIKVPTNLDIMTISVQNDLWLLGTSGDGILASADGRNWKIWNKEAGNTRSLLLVENSLILGLSSQGVVKDSVSMNEGLTNPAIRSLGYHNGKLYAGTYQKGVWRYDIPKTNFIPPSTTSRQVWKGVNIYPNPVSDGLVTVAYKLEELSDVSIQLYDAFGKLISDILHSPEQSKGFHEVNHNMNDLTGGTYYFHIQIGDLRMTKPIILIK